MKTSTRFVGAFALIAIVGGLLPTLLLWGAPPALAAGPAAAAGAVDREAWGLGLLAAAIATAVSSAGAGFAVAKVGTAAVGALAEKPELFGRLLIFVGLAEGIAIYGLIVSILVLNRLT